jgi:hypothetical protein
LSDSISRLHDWENHHAKAFSPALITILRIVLEEAMTKVPAEQAANLTNRRTDKL